MKKPSNIKTVKAKKAYLLPSKFDAITLFGIAYCNSRKNVELINKSGDIIDSIIKNHETIHIRQAENTKNSWFVFYLNYIWQWICNLPLITEGAIMPYKFIPYELEAFANETNYQYTDETANQWRKFKKLTLKEKRKFAQQYNTSVFKFRDFVKNLMIPYINKGEEL